MDDEVDPVVAYLRVEEGLRDLFKHLDERARNHIQFAWDSHIHPEIRERAFQSRYDPREYRRLAERAFSITERLYDALHTNSRVASDADKPRFFWKHMKFDLWTAHDSRRGIYVDKKELASAAAEYLSNPSVRTKYIDWLLLDSLIFAELDAFAFWSIGTKGGVGMNLAHAFADGSHFKYVAFSAVFSIVGFGISWVLPPFLAYRFFEDESRASGTAVLGIWLLFVAMNAYGYPARRRARKKVEELMSHLTGLYSMVEGPTISPRKLREELDRALAAGVVVDAAVFAIADRLVSTDSSAFCPFEWTPPNEQRNDPRT